MDGHGTTQNYNGIQMVELGTVNLGDGPEEKTVHHKVLVNRRSPINPFAKIKPGKGVHKDGRTAKSYDPSLTDNPLRGRLVVCILTTSAIIFVFLAELVFNKVTFNGRCLSKILYPARDKTRYIPPYITEFGYGACEYNLGRNAIDNVFIGEHAADEGWPTSVSNYLKNESTTSQFDSPNSRIYELFGGLNTNKIRNYKESFRIWWSMFMHGSWRHLLFNLVCQIQIFWMIEPDWGFWRTLGLFLIGGLGGNLTSAVLDPCGVTVGSSGAMYGLYGAMIPYCIEYWTTLPHPLFIVIFTTASIILGLFTGLIGYIDNYAHLGGCIAGFLWGFATIRSVSSFDKCTIFERLILCRLWAWMLPKKTKEKLELAIINKKDRGNKRRLEYEAKKRAASDRSTGSRYVSKFKKKLEYTGAPPCRMRLREWIFRLSSTFLLVTMFVLLWAFLFEPKLYASYKPPGQLKFTGWQSCHCCFISNKKELFETEDTPLQYLDRDLYWCWNDESIARHHCGQEFDSVNDSLHWLNSPIAAANQLVEKISKNTLFDHVE